MGAEAHRIFREEKADQFENMHAKFETEAPRHLAPPRAFRLRGGPESLRSVQEQQPTEIGLADPRLRREMDLHVRKLAVHHHVTAGGLGGGDDHIGLGERLDQRLFAKHVAALLQGRERLFAMEKRRSTDRDHVGLGGAEHFRVVGEDRDRRMGFFQLLARFRLHIATADEREASPELSVSRQMNIAGDGPKAGDGETNHDCEFNL